MRMAATKDAERHSLGAGNEQNRDVFGCHLPGRCGRHHINRIYTFGQRQVALAFIAGAFSSGLAGWLGMRVATGANVHTTQAAHTSLGAALDIAFSSGMVMGLCVVGLGLEEGHRPFTNGIADAPHGLIALVALGAVTALVFR